ncbi:MAG: hypothetical protein KIS66_12815 [Fimbriimonadaceae bacterium]|nr:hypothetical protein [Fimbriimonadaceae bacterium]
MAELARFGWYGFVVEHPSDWAPASLIGSRDAGYVRLASTGRIALQIRWTKAKRAPNLSDRLGGYFRSLARDAKKARVDFHKETKDGDRGTEYRWIGAGQGRGTVFHCAESARVFFVEVAGGRKDNLLAPLRRALDSFRSTPETPELWSLFDLAVLLPGRPRLTKRTLHSGKVWFAWEDRGIRIEAGRWSFAEQLVARHGLEPWARAALGFPNGEATVEQNLVRLRESSRFRPREALVRYDVAANRLITLSVRTRDPQRRPNWDWLA